MSPPRLYLLHLPPHDTSEKHAQNGRSRAVCASRVALENTEHSTTLGFNHRDLLSFDRLALTRRPFGAQE